MHEIREEDERLVRLVSTVASQLGSLMEKKHAEDMMLKKSTELARSNTELEQFAYVASHDLKEPLRVVASYVQLLEQRYKDKLDSDANRFIAHAVNAVSRMHALINDLLTYSKAGTQEKPVEAVDCEQVFSRTLENLRMSIEENGARVSHDPLPKIAALESEIQQVFQNLIGNAITFKSDQPPAVHVSAEPEGDFWIFSVWDNGIGIEPQHVNQIFKIFHRLHTRKDYPGNGIGLAISKKIVENYGGRIWVESKPGQGSVFYFTLPNNGGPKR